MTDLDIVRIPSDIIDKIRPTAQFKSMPILYLEFIENKTKLKPNMLGKNYEPKNKIQEEKLEEPKEELEELEESEESEESEELGLHESDEDSYVDSEEELDMEKIRHIVKNTSNDDNQDPTSEIKNPPSEISNKISSDETSEPQNIDTLIEPRVPTMTELQAKNPGRKINHDYTYPSDDDTETVNARNEVFFHYEVLKRMHPNANIPEFTIYTDPKIMAQKYELLAKKLSLDMSVNRWKRSLIIFVMGCEVVMGHMNFDMEGFAQQQITDMETYEYLLVEMAEKSYMPSGSAWSVEVRLLMTLSMNAVLFMISKLIMKKTGTTLLDYVNISHPEPKLKKPENREK